MEWLNQEVRKNNRKYFKNFILLANADGVIHEKEKKMLYRLGIEYGLSDSEIDEALGMEHSGSIEMPHGLKERFELFYNLFRIANADEVFDESEKRMIRYQAIASGFHEDNIDLLFEIMENGIVEGDDVDDLLKEYNKRVLK